MTTEAKHTPGPWHLCQHLKDFDQCSCGYRGGICGGDQEGMICEMGSTEIAGQEGLEMPRYPREQEFANARLIAAAPDLFSALERLDTDWTKTFPDGPEGSLDYYGIGKMADETVSIWRDIRVALKKARGQP